MMKMSNLKLDCNQLRLQTFHYVLEDLEVFTLVYMSVTESVLCIVPCAKKKGALIPKVVLKHISCMHFGKGGICILFTNVPTRKK